MRYGTLNNPSSPTFVTKFINFILESIILQLFGEQKMTKQNNFTSVPGSTWRVPGNVLEAFCGLKPGFVLRFVAALSP